MSNSLINQAIKQDEEDFRLALMRLENLTLVKSDSLKRANKINDGLISSSLESILTLEKIIDTQETNLEKLYNLDFEYQTKDSKKTYKDILSVDSFKLEELKNTLDILKSRKGELDSRQIDLDIQQDELDLAISKDPDIFDEDEFKAFLSAKDAEDPDTDLDTAGYQFGYQEYLKSDRPSKNINKQKNLSILEEYRDKKPKDKAEDYLTRRTINANSTSGLKNIYGLSLEAQNIAEDFTTNSNEYQLAEEAVDKAKQQLGVLYGSLFTSIDKAKEYHETYYGQYKTLHASSAGTEDTPPDFTAFYYDMKDSYDYYKTLNDDAKKQHDVIAAKFFGYDVRAMGSYEEFFKQAASYYAAYTMQDFKDLNIILPDSGEGLNDEPKDDIIDEFWD